MIIIHGVYHWLKKLKAYKNEFCTTCNAVQIAEQFRTLDVFHVFWIPLFPFGVFRRWRCTSCGHDPKEEKETSPFAKYLLLVFCLFLLTACTAALVIGGRRLPEEFRLSYILVDIIAGLIVIATLFWIVKGRRRTRSNIPVPQLEDVKCRYCGGKLMKDPEWHCRACDIWRY